MKLSYVLLSLVLITTGLQAGLKKDIRNDIKKYGSTYAGVACMAAGLATWPFDVDFGTQCPHATDRIISDAFLQIGGAFLIQKHMLKFKDHFIYPASMATFSILLNSYMLLTHSSETIERQLRLY